MRKLSLLFLALFASTNLNGQDAWPSCGTRVSLFLTATMASLTYASYDKKFVNWIYQTLKDNKLVTNRRSQFNAELKQAQVPCIIATCFLAYYTAYRLIIKGH